MRGLCIYAACAVFLVLTGCQQEKGNRIDGDTVREYAGDLINRQLYKQAIEQYQHYLAYYPVEPNEQANVIYIVSNTYFDRLKDYENALGGYLKIKHYYPDSPLMEEVNKRIIACLERLERSADAQQALQEAAYLDPQQVSKKRPGAVIARIGQREITLGDLEFELNQLPSSVRDQFNSRERKLEFLREFVAIELLYDTAKRSGMDNDAEVIEGAFQTKKALMVRKLLQERVESKIDIKEEDLELHYQAHKDDFVEKADGGKEGRQKSFAEVRQQVQEALYRERYARAYQDLIDRMVLAENVQFFHDRVN
ncbi:MAG TPA: hypothetical protein PKW76_06955 [bacterium]|nr:hypothetical protein [bacterium]HPG45401.1 hypothetical protein [bacterium]HPM96823.1 hypothetical protein [bacterium]